jgi:hypothetical protein
MRYFFATIQLQSLEVHAEQMARTHLLQVAQVVHFQSICSGDSGTAPEHLWRRYITNPTGAGYLIPSHRRVDPDNDDQSQITIKIRLLDHTALAALRAGCVLAVVSVSRNGPCSVPRSRAAAVLTRTRPGHVLARRL